MYFTGVVFARVRYACQEMPQFLSFYTSIYDQREELRIVVLIMKRLSWKLLLILIAVICAAVVAPALARGSQINDILPEDTIFVYENNLDLTGLQNQITHNNITVLREYTDGDPNKGIINEIPVSSDADFDLPDFLVTDTPATYYAYNPTDGVTDWIRIDMPELSISTTLAAPYHVDSVEGLSLPWDTDIAFKVVSANVGNYYHVGSTYPASVDIILTTPGGAETTVIGGISFTDLTVSSSQFYTDDPGRPGPVSLDFKESGLYKVRAEWNSPKTFADYAPASNVVTFSVSDRVGVDTTVPTTVPATIPATEPTVVVTTVKPTPLPTTVETPLTTTVPVTAETTAPTQAPAGLFTVVVGCIGGICIISMLKKR